MVNIAMIGIAMSASNVVAGVSALFAAPLAKRIGLINTMVFTHIPSNILLILIPLMPSAELAIVVLVARFCISQLDVPSRQAFVVKVVPEDERSAAAGLIERRRLCCEFEYEQVVS